jgi:hypothetical protein
LLHRRGESGLQRAAAALALGKRRPGAGERRSRLCQRNAMTNSIRECDDVAR